MVGKNTNRLPWRIEAFREYLAYETLQPTAAVLSIFEGETFNVRNPRIIEMQELLERRTGKTAWIPNRSGGEDIAWNLEGDVYRNKGRVLTSMLILFPKEFKDGNLVLTEFGRALARGLIGKEAFYDFILTRFKYPHPAWKDNWAAWTAAGRQLHPFIYILQVMRELYAKSPAEACLTTEEVAEFLHADPDHKKVRHWAEKIIQSRREKSKAETPRTDDVHRKISDILGFLCLTPYCYFKGNSVYLNLLTRHAQERTFFWGSRIKQNRLMELDDLFRSIGD